MKSSTILILENRPFWQSELMRSFQDDPVEIRACNSFVQMEQFYLEYQKSTKPVIGIVDFEINPAECLLFMGKYSVDSPVSSIVTGLPESSELEWTLRELGVSQILSKPFSGIQLEKTCRYIFEKSDPISC